jgi:molybdopterin synthase catalytic subunit
LRDGSELVWLPPVGGERGRGAVVRAELTREPLDLARLVSRSRTQVAAGSPLSSAWSGTDAGQKVVALEYDAYDVLAAQQLRSVAGEALARWPDARIAVQHRARRLVVGERRSRSRSPARTGPRRSPAAAVIDRVKEAVPIWKREESEGGARWLEGHDYKPAE